MAVSMSGGDVGPAAERYAGRALEHVVHLAQTIGGRGSCTPAEREAAEYAAEQLRRAGARDVHIEGFIGAASAYSRYIVAFGVALAGTFLALVWREPSTAFVAFVLHGLAIWGMLAESDFTPNWTRWIVPGRPSQNVVARQPARREATERIILTAHLDTHRTPGFNDSGTWQAIYSSTFRVLFGGLVAGAFLHLVLALSKWSWLAWVALLPGAVLLVGTVLLIWSDFTPFSPGAYDNGSGVGSALAVAERLGREPLGRTEVWFAFTGCEETGASGMASFLHEHRQMWREASLVNLDQMGLGRLYVRVREGMLIRRRPQPAMVALCRRIDVSLPQLSVSERPSQAYSDAAVAYKHGFPALSLGTRPQPGTRPIHRHQMSDTVETIEPEALQNTHVFVWNLLQAIDLAVEGGDEWLRDP